MTPFYNTLKQLRREDVTVGSAMLLGYTVLLILTLWPQAFLV